MKTAAIVLASVSALLCLPAPARSQAVTFADLHGTVITLDESYHQKAMRDGRVFEATNHETGRIAISVDNSLTEQWQTTSTNARNGHAHTGPVRSGTRELDKPFKGTHDDDGVWTFGDDGLVRLRVFNGGAGGLKRTISFTRDGDGLHCASVLVMAHETGVRGLRKASEVDNKPVQILELKQVSSTCQILKQ